MERLFSKTDIRKLIIPLIMEQTLAITVGIADSVMVSSVGEAAISGVSLVDMFNNLIIAVLAALCTGGAVVTGQFMGAGRREDACRSGKQLLLSVFLVMTGIALVLLGFRQPVLRLFFGNIEVEVMDKALIYFVISIFSFPFLALYNSGAALFRTMGNSAVTFKVSVLMNAINIVGNAICIYGLKMGVAGVAWPTLLSRAVAAVILIVLLQNQGNYIHLAAGGWRPDWEIIQKIFYIGIPGGVESGIFQLGRVIVVSIIAGFGTSQIAANGVANGLDSLGCIVGNAMGLAMITVIGRCAGARDESQIRYYLKLLLGKTYLYTFMVNSMILLSLPWILPIYGLTEETAGLAYVLVMIHNGFAIVFWPASFVLPHMLRACNDVRFTMVIAIFSMFAFRIGFSFLLGVGMGWGAIGVWIAMVFDWAFRTASFLWRYRKGRWSPYYKQ